MKKLFMILFLSFMAIGGLAYAGSQTSGERTERKGLMMGFGAGGGGAHLTPRDDRGLYMTNFKIGGGLSERVILMYEPIFNKMPNDVVVYTYLSSQIFLVDNFYVRPAIGLSFGTVSDARFFDVGFAGGMAAGYEWRFFRKFAVSPEGRFDYSRLDKGYNYYSYGLLADIRWYF